MPIDKNELRRVMGHFATGVTVITTLSKEGKMHGLTANAVSSLSLVPPLMIICVDKKAESYASFEESKVFTVNILADDQEDVSRRFAGSGGEEIEGVAYPRGAHREPRPHRARAHRECKLHSTLQRRDPTVSLGAI